MGTSKVYRGPKNSGAALQVTGNGIGFSGGTNSFGFSQDVEWTSVAVTFTRSIKLGKPYIVPIIKKMFLNPETISGFIECLSPGLELFRQVTLFLCNIETLENRTMLKVVEGFKTTYEVLNKVSDFLKNNGASSSQKDVGIFKAAMGQFFAKIFSSENSSVESQTIPVKEYIGYFISEYVHEQILNYNSFKFEDNLNKSDLIDKLIEESKKIIYDTIYPLIDTNLLDITDEYLSRLIRKLLESIKNQRGE